MAERQLRLDDLGTLPEPTPGSLHPSARSEVDLALKSLRGKEADILGPGLHYSQAAGALVEQKHWALALRAFLNAMRYDGSSAQLLARIALCLAELGDP